MQDAPLVLTDILRHGARLHADKQVITFEGDASRRASFAEVAVRAERLAAALRRLGVGEGDRVGTICLNNQEHMEAYLAVPCMGAVLHTLNFRLPSDQLAWVINDAGDKVLIVDAALVPALAAVADQLTTVEQIVVNGDASGVDLPVATTTYEALLAGEEPGYDWPELDERAAAVMCYTSGTTGKPKGVVYSHRSTWLHTLSVLSANTLGITDADRVLVVVPMFHVNAWGAPYAAWWVGADMVMPQRFLQAEPLAKVIAAERPTMSAGVPTVWNDLLTYSRDHDVDLSSLRMLTGGGSAVPRALMEAYRDRFGITLLQGWGMTETSPVCTIARPPAGVSEEESWDYRTTAGRILPGVQLRIVDADGAELPWDATAVGEIEVRGPWITGAYYNDPSPEKFHDGWLRTGDIGSVDPKGYVRITDRVKDVIKSGGEWISSVDLENVLMAHPAVAEASVIGIPDERWQERPLACVVLRAGESVTPEELKSFLADKVAGWWIPERWTFVEEIPKTSVGKFDKKVLRARHAEGGLPVVE